MKHGRMLACVLPSPAQHGPPHSKSVLVSIVFIALLFGIVQMGLVFFAVNFADEVTRHVARTAVVCDATAPAGAGSRLASSSCCQWCSRTASDVTIGYSSPAACIVNVNSTMPCVTVTINPGVEIPTFIPFWTFPGRSGAAGVAHDFDPESFATARQIRLQLTR